MGWHQILTKHLNNNIFTMKTFIILCSLVVYAQAKCFASNGEQCRGKATIPMNLAPTPVVKENDCFEYSTVSMSYGNSYES